MADDYSTKIGDDQKVLGAIAYIIPLLGGIIILLTAGDNKAMKFHAMQSIVLGIVVWILSFVCIGVFVWLYCLYGAYLIYTTGDFQSFVGKFVKENLAK
jgi:uncharacterized membrane protein